MVDFLPGAHPPYTQQAWYLQIPLFTWVAGVMSILPRMWVPSWEEGYKPWPLPCWRLSLPLPNVAGMQMAPSTSAEGLVR